MGWVGYTWAEIRSQDVNTLFLALEGRTELLISIFGKKEGGGDAPRRKMTSESFRNFARRHNQRYAERTKRRGTKGGG